MVLNANWGPYPPVAPFGHAALPAQRVVVPMVFPIIGKARWRNGYGDNRGTHRHTGIDIKAAKRSPIVAPFAGVIGLKRSSFWIYGDNGWAVLGTHLNDDYPGRNDNRASQDLMFAPNLVPGGRVAAGQLIGYVGDSGQATGPHLHFEMFAPGQDLAAKRLRNPFWSLKAAQRRKTPKPILPDVAALPPRGQLRMIGAVRKVVPSRRQVTLLLLAKQHPSGSAAAYAAPKYLKVKVPARAAQEVGGWSGLAALGASRMVSVYGVKSAGGLAATKLKIAPL
jgi:hypothetical protein